MIRKPDVIAVTGQVTKQATNEFVTEAEKLFGGAGAKPKLKKRGGVKKYKLLIPTELELHEKLKVFDLTILPSPIHPP